MLIKLFKFIYYTVWFICAVEDNMNYHYSLIGFVVLSLGLLLISWKLFVFNLILVALVSRDSSIQTGDIPVFLLVCTSSKSILLFVFFMLLNAISLGNESFFKKKVPGLFPALLSHLITME